MKMQGDNFVACKELACHIPHQLPRALFTGRLSRLERCCNILCDETLMRSKRRHFCEP